MVLKIFRRGAEKKRMGGASLSNLSELCASAPLRDIFYLYGRRTEPEHLQFLAKKLKAEQKVSVDL